MFQKVMEWLEADEETHKSGFGDETTRIATASLFYHMISVDGVVTPAEMKRLHKLLRERYKLDDEQLSSLARRGEDMDKSTAGLFPFAVILNRELNYAEREQILEQLATLARVDGIIHPLELEMLDQMKIMLKLTD